MPNRILKESICTSINVDALSPEAEVLWYRLLVQCDDFGRYDARPCVIRARCFPLRLDRVSDEDVIGWMRELIDARLLWVYQADGRDWLQITTWSKHQQTRATKSKYPDPPSDETNGNQLLADDINRNQLSPYSYSYSNTNTHGANENNGNGADAPGVTDSPKPKRQCKPIVRSDADTRLMDAFCKVTGFTVPTRIQDANWWYATLREIPSFVDGDLEQAVTLVGDTVRQMRTSKEPLRITSPKSIIGMARARAQTRQVGYEL